MTSQHVTALHAELVQRGIDITVETLADALTAASLAVHHNVGSLNDSAYYQALREAYA